MKYIDLDELEESPTFRPWENLDFNIGLRMKLTTYREEPHMRQASFRNLQRNNIHLPHMLGT